MQVSLYAGYHRPGQEYAHFSWGWASLPVAMLPVQHKLATLCKHKGAIANSCSSPGFPQAQQIVGSCLNAKNPREGHGKQIWPAKQVQERLLATQFGWPIMPVLCSGKHDAQKQHSLYLQICSCMGAS